jgi:hypothetical protein
MNEMDEYTLRWRGREMGPFPLAEINRRLDEHEIGMGHEIFHQDKWITLEEFFASQPKPNPPKASQPAPSSRSTPPQPVSIPASPAKASPLQLKVSLSTPPPRPVRAGVALRPRYRLLFAFLAIIAGFIGLHNFYARTGLLQLLLSVATFLMGFGIIASWLWAMVEALLVHKDGEGIDMI